MLILLTGGNGYVGVNILNFIQKHTDWDLVCLINKHENNIPKNIKKIYDLNTPTCYDVIIHVGGDPSSKSCIENPGSAFYNNIEITFTLLEYARINQCKRFILFSGCEVYGKSQASSCETDRLYSYNMYGASKVSCEHMVTAYHHCYGISSYIIRLLNTYGPYCQPERFPSIVKKKFEEEEIPHFILTSRSTKRWLNIQDVAERTIFLIKNMMSVPVCDVFNFVGDEDLSLVEFIEKMSNGKKFTYEHQDIQINGYTSSANAKGDKFKLFRYNAEK